MSSLPCSLMAKFIKERFHFETQMKLEKWDKDDTGHMVLKNDSDGIHSKYAY